MTQDQLASNDLNWLATEYKKESDYLHKQQPKLIVIYQDLINREAPLAEILRAKQELEDLLTSSNSCNTKATYIALKAITDTLIDTDVKNARNALECSVAKLKMAQDKFEDVRNNLIIVGKFIELGAVLIAAAPTAGAGLPLASIASVIDAIDNVVSIELKKTLSQAEWDGVSEILATKCAKASKRD